MRTPLAILAFLAAAPGFLNGQTTIPLTKESAQGQLGIYVKLGTNPNPFQYLLDTGSAGFFSALGNTTSWQGALTNNATMGTFSVNYTSGLAYSGNVVNNDITLSNSSGDSLLAIPSARMGIITNQPYADWNTNINSIPPVAPEKPNTNLYFGTLGAGLYQVTGGGADVVSVLNQVPLVSGLTKGFIVSTGGRGASNQATLTVGLTQSLIESFPILIKMRDSTGVVINDNFTLTKIYPESQARAHFVVTNGSTTNTTTADLVMDTGGLNTHFTTGKDVDIPSALITKDSEGKDILEPGASFTMSINGTTIPGTGTMAQGLEWVIDPTGTTPYLNKIGVKPGSHRGSLNSGIALFYDYDVMFDTENGVIGLRPVPEPSAFALCVVTIVAAWILRRRRAAA